jgi:hypothetical protein
VLIRKEGVMPPKPIKRTKIVLPVQAIRSLQNPVDKNVKEYYAYIKCTDLAESELIPNEPNPRNPIAYKSAFEDLKEAVQAKAEDFDIFHYSALGIFIFCGPVETNESEVSFELFQDDGIFNGGHLYQAIRESAGLIPENRMVRVHFISGINKGDLRDEVAENNNKSTALKPWSLINSKGGFDGIKEVFKNSPYEEGIEYFEGDESGPLKISDILVILELMKIDGTEMTMSPRTKSNVYGGTGSIVKNYAKDMKSYSEQEKDLLSYVKFRDYVQETAYKMWCEATGESIEDDPYVFSAFKGKLKKAHLYTDESTEYVLTKAALLPILAGFRTVGIRNPKFSYLNAKKIWDKCGADLINIAVMAGRTYQNSKPVGYDSNVWYNIFKTAKFSIDANK